MYLYVKYIFKKCIKSQIYTLFQWRSQDFGSGGNTLGGQPRGGFFENFKKFLKKIAKNA